MHGAVSRWSLFVAAGALVTTGLAGCGGDDDKAADDSPSASPGSGQSSGPSSGPAKAVDTPLKFDQTGSVTFPETGVMEAVVTDTVALTRSSSEITARELPDLSSAYKISASGGAISDLWVGPDQKVGVAVEVVPKAGIGTQVGEVGVKVTQFAIATGQVTSAVTVSTSQDPTAGATPPTARVLGVSGSTAVVDLWAATDPNDTFATSSSRHTTLAVDLGAKKLAWQARPARPLAMSPSRVVVSTGSVATAGEVRALGLDRGRVLWSALPGVRQASSAGVSDDRVVVVSTTTRSGGGNATSLSLDDGTGGPGVPAGTWSWTCFPTSTALAVCRVGGGSRLVGWDIDKNAAAWSLPTSTRVVPSVTAVVDGIVYGAANGTGVALDAKNGKDVGVATGSVPISVSKWGAVSLLDNQAVFQRSVAPK